MSRFLRMSLIRGLVFGFALLAAACGRQESVASKSAAAYDEARAKGVAVGGGHDHGDHGAAAPAAPAATAADHSAHGTAADPHAGMQHGTTTGAMDHSAHGAGGAVDHAAMGHGTAAGHATHGGTTSADHGAHGTGTTGSQHAQHGATGTAHTGHGTSGTTRGASDTAGAHDMHAGMQHGTTRPGAADPHAAHTQQRSTATAHAQHGTPQPGATQHGTMQHGAAATPGQHAGHGAPTAATPIAPPRTNQEMQRMQPAATLQTDAFDAPAPISVSEAAKAAHGGGHEGHDMRGITPGEDRENPPSPMPATRDGTASPPPADHSQHKPPAETD